MSLRGWEITPSASPDTAGPGVPRSHNRNMPALRGPETWARQSAFLSWGKAKWRLSSEVGVYCGGTLREEGNGPGRRRSPLKVTLNQTDGRLTDPAVPHRPPRRVLSELPGSERGARRSVCPLEAGVDRGCDGTFVERVAVLLPVQLLLLLLKAAVLAAVVDFHREPVSQD